MAGKVGPTADDIMSGGEMKPLLIKSKQEPVNCAIGLTEDKEGVVLLHRKTKPRKLLADLRSQAKKLKLGLDTGSLRFGTAEVDPEIDSALVRFRVNKPCAGTMEVKLRAHLKESGFQKVEIVVDESLETEEDAEETEEAPSGQNKSSVPPPPPPPPLPDAKALAAALAQLMQQIPKAVSANAAAKDQLIGLAGKANELIKSGDLAAASSAIGELRLALANALQHASTTPPPASDGTGTVAYAKSRLAWLAARKKVEGELQKLQAEILKTYEGQSFVSELKTAYANRVTRVMASLDEQLADKLDEATNATDPAPRATLVGEAKAIMEKYREYVASEPLITDFDENPFAPLSIRAMITTTLTALERAVH